MRIGMVGLGRMGGAMAQRLRSHGHEVVGYDRHAGSRDVDSLPELVARLDGPRRAVWLMLPAGEATETTVSELVALLSREDLVVDGGNANYRDSQRRGTRLAQHGIGFVDAGVSGGIRGLDAGYSIMAGGSDTDVARLRPVFDALVADGGFAHVGPVGAGHFTKMAHNGVEYGLMQSFAEGYELLTRAPVDIDVAAAFEVWRHGSVVRSWLLDLLADALADDPQLSAARGYAEDSGEGRWAVQEAVDLGVPTPAISAALHARFASRQDDPPAMRVVATLRNRFGGHEVRT